MDWIFKHFQVVLALAGGVAWLLKQIKGAQPGEAESPPPSEEKSFADPELAERTRRIREEIQRKIEQRAKGYAMARPQPVTPPMVVTAAEPPPVRPSASRQETHRAAEILEQQRTLMEKLQEANLLKAAAEKRTEFEAATADHVPAALTQARSDILEDLRTPEALRRAFILREVLGPPLALRG